MSTVIRFKRKKLSEGTNNIEANVKLFPGEPLYNLNDNHFYIGNSNGTPDDITKITSNSAASNVVSFHIGSDTNNKYEKTINDVENVTTKINGKNITDIFEDDGTTVKSSISSEKLTTNAGSATQPVYFANGKPVACDNSIDKATTTKLGLVKIGYEKPVGESKNYQPVLMSNDGKLYVEVTGEISGTITNAKDAQNVTSLINGKKIIDIFESDGITVKSTTKLKTSRTVQVDLSSTNSVSFDGTENIQPGVKGVLQVKNGGTGVATLNELKATSTKLGLVKVGYTKNGSKLPVELENDQMFVDITSTTTKIENLEEQLTWGKF